MINAVALYAMYLFILLALTVGIIGIIKPNLLLAFEEKYHRKVFRIEPRPDALTTKKIRRLSAFAMGMAIFFLVLYCAMVFLN